MGFFSFFKKILGSEEEDEQELDAARARHGIQLNAQDRAEMKKMTSDEDRFAGEYDAWEDIKQMRTSFFIGSWAARKFHVVGEDKVKKQLADLEQKREEEAKKKEWEKWNDK